MPNRIITQSSKVLNTPDNSLSVGVFFQSDSDKQLALLNNDIPEIKLAYLAGIFDGEGCIHVNTRDNEAFTYQLSVTSTDIELLNWIKDLVGGRIYGPFKGKKNWRNAYYWHANGLHGKRILQAISPYLILKKEAAQLFIEAVTISYNNNNRKRSPQFKQRLTTLALKIQATHSRKGNKIRIEN